MVTSAAQYLGRSLLLSQAAWVWVTIKVSLLNPNVRWATHGLSVCVSDYTRHTWTNKASVVNWSLVLFSTIEAGAQGSVYARRVLCG